MVLQPDAPQISLSGVGPHLARPAPEFEGPRGVPLFPELRIVCSLSHAVNTAAQGMEGGGELANSPSMNTTMRGSRLVHSNQINLIILRAFCQHFYCTWIDASKNNYVSTTDYIWTIVWSLCDQCVGTH